MSSENSYVEPLTEVASVNSLMELDDGAVSSAQGSINMKQVDAAH